ncbi:hypothetical protein CW749_21690 [Vibrio sp. vnigr-6D03]|uniref:hypothetical protein n=1 Tax=Vibrio sp. vnigr-6D03 TaxID=2058088 RepID=UPI000C31CB5C|nr:hypothetical protein [Vibrio sp. vnigr-6D03]PKF77473.1 hypothetical protein CW749_21690 [Vibrio sp. vnigr-6D03]
MTKTINLRSLITVSMLGMVGASTFTSAPVHAEFFTPSNLCSVLKTRWQVEDGTCLNSEEIIYSVNGRRTINTKVEVVAYRDASGHKYLATQWAGQGLTRNNNQKPYHEQTGGIQSKAYRLLDKLNFEICLVPEAGRACELSYNPDNAFFLRRSGPEAVSAATSVSVPIGPSFSVSGSAGAPSISITPPQQSVSYGHSGITRSGGNAGNKWQLYTLWKKNWYNWFYAGADWRIYRTDEPFPPAWGGDTAIPGYVFWEIDKNFNKPVTVRFHSNALDYDMGMEAFWWTRSEFPSLGSEVRHSDFTRYLKVDFGKIK